MSSAARLPLDTMFEINCCREILLNQQPHGYKSDALSIELIRWTDNYENWQNIFEFMISVSPWRYFIPWSQTFSPLFIGEQADLFTGALYIGYGPPPGFCFDIFCNDDPIQVTP